MASIHLETYIEASAERCFDLSLSVELHRRSVAHTHERPVAGVTMGLMKLGETVTWEAVHFGIRQYLTSKITAYERPHRFIDEMVQGPFQDMQHIHEFIPQSSGTLMIDRFAFHAPWGILGRLAETLFLTRYMKGLLLSRNRYLKQVAEADTDKAHGEVLPMSNQQASQVQVGDPAPDFMLPTQAGSPIRLKDVLGKSAVVLFFYPKDNSGGCTKEACSFRDSYEVFKEAGAEVIGISSDSIAAHSEFAQKHRLPFLLASDTGGELRKRYGVPATFGIFPGRVTYIIDQQGIVRHIFSSQFMPQKHIAEALDILKALATK